MGGFGKNEEVKDMVGVVDLGKGYDRKGVDVDDNVDVNKDLWGRVGGGMTKVKNRAS